ncbi:MAG: 6-phosphofructokinase [Geothrix sp.]|jgi:6-phosphofructokinase 1|uniref:ATP-dependent 6-phosphofructokinase n=1 Tax=Candidatus Geothrix odensensis TaxID=2954440 RepID=A0A936F2T7_9BACT|nr:6-phosphofructokinase [Candidatus Geothrix odensensis]MCC6514192.1 6-phosphofructokinase [Geothrix sp.]
MKIGVLTSGGDAPGMNAAIRAAVRQADALGHEAWGIHRGYQGLLEGDLAPLPSRACANILQRGGTMLQTARCPEFHEPATRAKAAGNLKAAGIEALVVIGGDGSFRAAEALQREHGVACAGIPGTIDNDLAGTERTLGFDTALNTAVEAIDRIRDTASSHGRLFLVEVMGRSSGMLAVHTALACGAEAVLYPESPDDSYEVLVSQLEASWLRGKRSSIVVVAEGDTVGRAMAVGERLKRDHPLDLRVVVLGHVQRGGSPSAMDRIWGSRWGAEAVRRLDRGESGFYLGEVGGALVAQPIARVLEPQPVPPGDLGRLVTTLAR